MGPKLAKIGPRAKSDKMGPKLGKICPNSSKIDQNGSKRVPNGLTGNPGGIFLDPGRVGDPPPRGGGSKSVIDIFFFGQKREVDVERIGFSAAEGGRLFFLCGPNPGVHPRKKYTRLQPTLQKLPLDGLSFSSPACAQGTQKD